MPQSHVQFHSTDGKRTILVIEDELINREILRMHLQDTHPAITEDCEMQLEAEHSKRHQRE